MHKLQNHTQSYLLTTCKLKYLPFPMFWVPFFLTHNLDWWPIKKFDILSWFIPGQNANQNCTGANNCIFSQSMGTKCTYCAYGGQTHQKEYLIDNATTRYLQYVGEPLLKKLLVHCPYSGTPNFSLLRSFFWLNALFTKLVEWRYPLGSTLQSKFWPTSYWYLNYVTYLVSALVHHLTASLSTPKQF